MPFSDIMEDRIREDPKLSRPFEAARTWVAQGTPRNMDAHIEIMKLLSKEMQDDFGMVESLNIRGVVELSGMPEAPLVPVAEETR